MRNILIPSKTLQLLDTWNPSELFLIHLQSCLSSRQILYYWKLSKSIFDDLLVTIKHKYFKSLAQSGEAVGIIAAQSIGNNY